ncbi:hypothetical protein FPJ27_01660 [Burkholderia sp. MS455]|nr:hypothetical protein FPJ27_01660 [Burkholderia sp. MS455]
MHTDASASIHDNPPSSPERGLRSTLGVPIPGSGPAGAVADDFPGSRRPHDDARRLHAQSTSDAATFMGRPVMSCDGALACVPSRGQPLDAMARAFAIAVRPA